MNRILNNTEDRHHRLSSVLIRWLGLLLGFFLVWVFMFVIAPAIKQTPAVKPLTSFIEDSGIDARALFYTEIEETAEAEMYLHDAASYPPSRGSQ